MAGAPTISETTVPGPHLRIAASSLRERFTLELFDRLWERYRRRVSYVALYEKVIEQQGATFVNDHIAFRTFAAQQPFCGIGTLGRIFEALGYNAAGCYNFPDKHLSAIHFQHPHPEFPKLFVSELRTWELSDESRSIIEAAVQSHRAPLTGRGLSHLARPDGLDEQGLLALLKAAEEQFHELPWDVPQKADVEALNRESQYAAWVLVHGYCVNHFTSLINSHQCASMSDIDKTVAVLREAGIPMKAEIEGAPGSKLRQTATEAVMLDVPVRDDGSETLAPWSYAYFELAERNEFTDPETGKSARFQGFLGPQATQLFEMTKVAKS